MIWRRKNGKEQANPNATVEDFCRLFAVGMDELYQLSFLLTADHQKTERCFLAGLEECVKSNHVFKEWARSWAKRTIIENAIRQLKPHSSLPSAPAFTVPLQMGELSDTSDSHRKLNTVLALPHFERFVFVMSVLEHYSEHDSAILLGCTPWGNPGSPTPGSCSAGYVPKDGFQRNQFRKSSGAKPMIYVCDQNVSIHGNALVCFAVAGSYFRRRPTHRTHVTRAVSAD